MLDDRAEEFLRRCLLENYGEQLPAEWQQELHPTLRTTYRRVTLARAGGGERVTCDFHFAANPLGPGAAPGPPAVMASNRVIVELKSDGRARAARDALRRLGARPLLDCTKYCIGIALTHHHVPGNDFRRVIRRHFGWAPGALPTPRAA